MPPLAAPMPINSAVFQSECMCCQNEHLPSLLYSLWQASPGLHFGLHLHSQWLMTLSIIYHLYPFFRGIVYPDNQSIISWLPFYCEVVDVLCRVEIREVLYRSLPSSGFGPQSDACKDPENHKKTISLSERGPYRLKEGNVPKQGCVRIAQLRSECDVRRQQTLCAL